MILTKEHQEAFRKWLEARASSGLRCFVCGNQNWTIGDVAAMTSSIDVDSGRIHYMRGFPLIALICGSCAHTVWFNANMIGIKPKEPAPEG